jgi:hypothetical protein
LFISILEAGFDMWPSSLPLSPSVVSLTGTFRNFIQHSAKVITIHKLSFIVGFLPLPPFPRAVKAVIKLKLARGCARMVRQWRIGMRSLSPIPPNFVS